MPLITTMLADFSVPQYARRPAASSGKSGPSDSCTSLSPTLPTSDDRSAASFGFSDQLQTAMV